jgi:hypothetical protein
MFAPDEVHERIRGNGGTYMEREAGEHRSGAARAGRDRFPVLG